MTSTARTFSSAQLRTDLPLFRSGQTIRVHEKIQEKDKERIQIFQGMIIAVKGGTGINATITVRAMVEGVGVERVFPIHSPRIETFEIIKQEKVRRSKLYFLRKDKKKRKMKEDKVGLERSLKPQVEAQEAALKTEEEAKAKAEAEEKAKTDAEAKAAKEAEEAKKSEEKKEDKTDDK